MKQKELKALLDDMSLDEKNWSVSSIIRRIFTS